MILLRFYENYLFLLDLWAFQVINCIVITLIRVTKYIFIISIILLCLLLLLQ